MEKDGQGPVPTVIVGGPKEGEQEGGKKLSNSAVVMEEGWVLIDKRDELDDEVSGGRDEKEGDGHSLAPAEIFDRSSRFASHLFISTHWLDISSYSRWMYCQWQECERYAWHIAHFFPSDAVVERRRAAVEDERRRAGEEAHLLVEIELKRRSDLEARLRKEGESGNRWVDAILQRWAAVDAQKRRDEQGGDTHKAQETAAVRSEDEREGRQMERNPRNGDATKEATEEERRKAKLKPGEEQEKKEESVKPVDEKEQIPGKPKDGEERKRLKEEGRKRFREWKKNESDRPDVITATTSAHSTGVNDATAERTRESGSLGQSAERELEGWELIDTQDGEGKETVKGDGQGASGKAGENSREAEEEELSKEGDDDSKEKAGGDVVDEEERRLRERSEACLRQHAKEKAGEKGNTRFLPFAHPRRKALACFDHWRRSLWFAPAGFSSMIEGQTAEVVWVPYYAMRLTVISSFKAKIAVAAQTRPDDRPEGQPQKAKKTEVKEIVVSKESVYENLLVCASTEEVDQTLMKSIEEWDVASAVDLLSSSPSSSSSLLSSATTVIANAAQGDGGEAECGVSVRNMIGPNDAWKKAEKEIIAREKEACREQIKNEHSPQKIQQLILTKLTFKGRPSFSAVYVPVYLITYSHKGKRYAYVANGQTGRGSGERPYGVGNVIGGGIGLLENIFGVNEQETAGILSGQALKKVDNSPHYKDAGWYLVFPPSHSYLITSATGFITLRNAGTRDIVLSSQPRGGEKVIATHVLASGETETFDYKGNWCIELRDADGNRGQPDIELVEFQASGGGHYGNKLGMSYWLL